MFFKLFLPGKSCRDKSPPAQEAAKQTSASHFRLCAVFDSHRATLVSWGCSVTCPPVFVLVTPQGPRTDEYWNTLCVYVTLPHPPKCFSLLAGIRCPRAARHSTAWCKWGALCKWSYIFKILVLGSHVTLFFHPSRSCVPLHPCFIHILFCPPLKISLFTQSFNFLLHLFRWCHQWHIPFYFSLPLSLLPLASDRPLQNFNPVTSSIFPFIILRVCALHVLSSRQLTKLHQLAMQQSPFPIAHSNQGFQGRWTDGRRQRQSLPVF